MNKNGKTDGQAEGSSEYGNPIYLTINGKDKTAEEISYIVNKAIEEAAEYGSLLYVTVNGGAPPQPPPKPPGGNG